MATLDTLQDAVNTLTSSTTTLLNEVSVNKSTLTESKDLAETAATSATTQAAAAASSASAASSSASSASASASAASASAASASAIVTGVATGMPSVRPSLNLDFVNSKTVDPRISFTRSTTATYYDGKTTAKAEENLLKNSSNIGNANGWSVGALTVTQNSAVAPDGTTTATKLTTSASLSDQWMWQAMSRYYGEATSSVYVKAATHNYVRITTYDSTGTFAVTTVDLTNGNILSTVTGGGMDGTETVTVTSAGNGWYRIAISQTFQTSGIGIHIQENSTDFSNSSYGVRAWTGTGAESIYVWGAQIEGHPSATAYTPTTTSPITNYIPVLQTAAINEPRLDHDPVTGEAKGLLIEESRTNLAYPSDTSTWTGARTIRRANTVISPFGTINGVQLSQEDGNVNLGNNYFSVGVTEGATYTYSVYAKSDGSFDSIRLITQHATDGVAIFNLNTGTKGASAAGIISTTMEDAGNGWYRCSITFTADFPSGLVINYNAHSTNYDSFCNGYNGIFVWGAQLEVGSFPTSYIPTSGASVTRARDYAELSATSWISQSKGTMYFDTTSFDNSGYPGLGLLKDSSTSNNFIGFYHNANSQRKTCSITWNGSNQANFDTNVVGYADKLALAYSVNDTACAAGSAVVNDTTCLIPVMDTLKLGVDYGSQVLNGYVKQVMYYPERVADSEILSLTSN